MQVKKDLKIFILIVTFNGMKWLPECLESTSPYSVIVIDNCSTDGTIEFIKSNYPEVVLLEQEENLGFGRANNIGMSYALKNQADFVFLLNQDAKLNSPKILETLINISIKNPDYGVISPLHLGRKESDLEPIFFQYLNKKKELFRDLLLNKPLADLYEYNMINAAAWLIPRHTLEKVGGFHPMFFLYGEDDNYCQRVLYHRYKIGICPQVSIMHDSGIKYHKTPETGSKEYYEKFLNQIKVRYGNVNLEEYKNLSKFRNRLLKESFKSFLKLQPEKSHVAWNKWRLIKKLDFSMEIEKTRKVASTFLNNS